MDELVIFKTPEGGFVILYPTSSALEKYTLQEIAEKDVPAGLPFKIIKRSELPEDRTFAGAWDIDDSELTDGVGADRTEFLEQR